MGYMSEYIDKGLSAKDLEKELLSLIGKYNKLRKVYLLVYASAINKNIPDRVINQEDYYLIADILRDKVPLDKLDVYLESPGGSGEAAEEIVNYFRGNCKNVSFVISGEAKSAATIMVLSGDDILMTKTGSLGPIDAQTKIGRTVISAYDYVEWILEKRKEAGQKGRLNPFDATMVAQISPGELMGVFHSLKFAEDLVVKWLQKYKFKNWNKTETHNIPVTSQMKQKRAQGICREFINHAKWRSHGRSIKIQDLESIKLKIEKIDGDQKLKDLVYRIQTVCRMLFSITSTFKIIATEDDKLFKQALKASTPIQMAKPAAKSGRSLEIAKLTIECPKCKEKYNIYAKFKSSKKIDDECKKEGCLPFPKDNKVKCKCGFEIDLGGVRNDLEVKVGAKVL